MKREISRMIDVCLNSYEIEQCAHEQHNRNQTKNSLNGIILSDWSCSITNKSVNLKEGLISSIQYSKRIRDLDRFHGIWKMSQTLTSHLIRQYLYQKKWKNSKWQNSKRQREIEYSLMGWSIVLTRTGSGHNSDGKYSSRSSRAAGHLYALTAHSCLTWGNSSPSVAGSYSRLENRRNTNEVRNEKIDMIWYDMNEEENRSHLSLINSFCFTPICNKFFCLVDK